mgnify:CR=1 FL=1
MQKEYDLYLEDILESIEKIEKYTKEVNYAKFAKDTLISDAVIRNLEIIGEAVKKIPHEIRKKADKTEWKKIAGLRDILIHAYFGINKEIIWDIVTNKLPPLKNTIKEILKHK